MTSPGLLIDTHVALWWVAAPERLSVLARSLLEDADTRVLFSSISSAEIAIKHGIGRLTLPAPVNRFVTQLFTHEGFTPLAFEHAHAFELAQLPLHHRDPFDRMLIAQARAERVPLVSADTAFARYDVDLRW